MASGQRHARSDQNATFEAVPLQSRHFVEVALPLI